MSFYKNLAATGAACVALGTGIGYWVEKDANETAAGRIITADTCLKTVPHENLVTEQLENCLEDGVPGGKAFDTSIDINDPIEYVEAYRTHQVERMHFDMGRVAVYSVGTPIVIGGLVFFFG